MSRRRGPGESVHDYQHALIAERAAHLDGLRRGGTGVDKYRRREADKRHAWTLTGHLRSQHGYRRGFLGMNRAQVEELHRQLHAEDSR